ncbi:MAG: CoA transferase subunit A [Bacteroidales bacterium]|nr:CoA transferase subunit A [Bacteroidales bacterium]
MDKLITIKEAVDKLKDGMTIMVGGFLTTGGPNLLMDAIAESGINELTLVCNDAAFADKGLGKLIANKQVRKLITSYIGSNPTAIELMNSSQMEIEFSPQGTLIERIRAAGAGLGGVLTPTGLGTMVENGKQVIELDEKKFILEKPIKADISFIGASISDKMGNLYYKGTTRNFNPLMAMAADIVIAEVEQVVEIGAIEPENIHTPAILVDYLIVK